MINNINDLAEYFYTTVDGIEKEIYKNTNCGAWIKILDDGIKIGSIVEGSDAETQTHTLKFPFSVDCFDNAIQDIEKEADILWKEANESEGENYE